METNAVETRVQKVTQKKQATLTVPDSISEYTISDLVSLQAEDSSLAYLKDKAVSAKLAKMARRYNTYKRKDSIIDSVKQQVRMDENTISW